MAIIETFEDIVANWVIDDNTNATGTVTRSNEQADAGTYSAKCFTTASGDIASVYDTINSTWAPAATEYYWQKLRMYIPAATVNALSGSEYMDIAGAYASAGSDGYRLRIMAGGAMYGTGYFTGGSGPNAFNIYGTIPTDQWFDLEFGLHSENNPGVLRSFAVIINGAFYGFYRRGNGSATVNRLEAGILGTNSADDLTVYVDSWYEYTTSATPGGTDNRPTANSYIRDYSNASGENVEFHWATWWYDLRFDANGFWSHDDRMQGGINHGLMPSMGEGWAEIIMKWVGGTTPTWPPSEYFAPMIAFRKSIPAEENLEIIPRYSAGNVLLHYDAWINYEAHALATWQMPTEGGNTYPGDGDKIFLNWREVDANSIRVIVDYYDATTSAWNNRIIDTTNDLTNVGGHGSYMNAAHKGTSTTIDTAEYSILQQSIGILSTSPRKRLTESTTSSSTALDNVTTTTTVYIETDTTVAVNMV